MTDKLWMRNPQTGKMEVKEFAADSQLALLRVSDPVLTSIAQGFRNEAMIGDSIFPSVRTEKETGRFPAFGKEAFKVPANIKRAVGEKVQKMLVQSGYITTALSEYALGFSVERRELNEFAGNPDQLLTMRQNMVADNIALYREHLQAVLATTSSGYASTHRASGASLKWATDGDPVVDAESAFQTVLQYNGRRPDLAWFSPAAWKLFRNNPNVLKRITYQGTSITPAQISLEAAAQLLQVSKVVVGYAVSGVGVGGGKGQGALTMSFEWDAVQSANFGMCITGLGWGVPSFGYTYERMNSPIIESYYDPTTKSQVYDYEHFFDSAITLNTAGYLYYSIA